MQVNTMFNKNNTYLNNLNIKHKQFIYTYLINIKCIKMCIRDRHNGVNKI